MVRPWRKDGRDHGERSKGRERLAPDPGDPGRHALDRRRLGRRRRGEGARRRPGRPRAKLPEVVRTEDHEDVDGRTRKPEGPRSRKGTPTLTPAQIDELILKGLAATKTPVSEPTSDEEFIRRVYLDVLGRLPNPGAIREFVDSRARNKRALLIDALLTNPEFAENWARYWRDVIAYRSPNENDRQVNYPAFEKWLAEQFAANKPWDKIATEIITATGRNDENGATAFALAEEGSPVEMAGEVSRVFLGVQIQCAQCHDHPSDPWKRQQFHEFAAFFSGVKSRRVEKAEKGKPPVFMVAADGPTHYTMPDLKNPEKKIPISPRFFLNDAPKVSEQVKADERLKLVARYVTDPENPWFARAFINRVWYSLMGEGFYNPVDDLGPTRTPNSPEVLDLVAEQVGAGRLRHPLAVPDDPQHRGVSAGLAVDQHRRRPDPVRLELPSRLRADQIFDALTHALDLDHERDQAGRGRPRARPPARPPSRCPRASAGRDDVRQDLRRRPLDAQRRRPGHDPPGPLPDEQPAGHPGDPGQAELDARLPPDDPPRQPGGPRHPLPPGPGPTAEREGGRGPARNYLHSVGDRAEAFEDILWALLNSTEFVSRR